ncbi:hypothetical protein RCL_jg28398.t2 [Rhizophagus clarus]|uniref:Uncharacterized protein n=1 Tax=Rhizophagus clarus TaxID=94130 RepID=A0A8H3R356_9GLOM|nr:hypothetical protein RCL_jg28398.t2 [Rhizophagus clarus]
MGTMLFKEIEQIGLLVKLFPNRLQLCEKSEISAIETLKDENEIVQRKLIHIVKGIKALHDARFAYHDLSEFTNRDGVLAKNEMSL